MSGREVLRVFGIGLLMAGGLGFILLGMGAIDCDMNGEPLTARGRVLRTALLIASCFAIAFGGEIINATK